MRVPGIPTHQLGGKLITICWHYRVSTLLISEEMALCCDEVRIQGVKGQAGAVLGWHHAGMDAARGAHCSVLPLPMDPEVKGKSLSIARESLRAVRSSVCLFWGLLNI